jgi:hypothetical protein
MAGLSVEPLPDTDVSLLELPVDVDGLVLGLDMLPDVDGLVLGAAAGALLPGETEVDDSVLVDPVLGAAVLGDAVLGDAVLGDAVLGVLGEALGLPVAA